jgi:hypothetical protein
MKFSTIRQDDGTDWLGDLSQLPRSTSDWQRHGPKCGAWYTSEAHPTVVIRHCGHPTALRPYYLDGVPTLRKFRLLEDAKAAVEAVANKLIEPEVL